MQILLLVFAVIAGVLNTVQSGSNATLNKRLDHPLASATVVYVAGLVVIVIAWLGALVIGRANLPTHDHVAQVPWYAWGGGMLGLVFVFGTLLVAPKVGAAVYTTFSVSAAVLTALMLDHFGWMGFQQHPAGPGRLVGAGLIVAGLALIAKF